MKMTSAEIEAMRKRGASDAEIRALMRRRGMTSAEIAKMMAPAPDATASVDTELGGKPNPGTPPDKRLEENPKDGKKKKKAPPWVKQANIEQGDDGRWTLTLDDDELTFADDDMRSGYEKALAALVDASAVDEESTGLLDEAWVSPGGIAFSETLAGGRDFTEVEWSWRDPTVSLTPLMLQTKNEPGHQGSVLAGFASEFWMDGTTPYARGRFYDSEAGRAARDILKGGDRFGVSVDPSEAVDYEASINCTETNDAGECIAGEKISKFTKYQIAGLTMCPFPAFERASIVLDSGEPVRASASTVTPPREWMRLPEPVPGAPWFDGLDADDVLVEQFDKNGDFVGIACPLTIRDDGLVYGHLTYWGQCHTGDPWGRGVCASATPSRTGYAEFHTGEVACGDGSRVPTGRLVVGCEHSDAHGVAGVRDHLAHAGMGWADVHVVDGDIGPWLCGVLDPSLTAEQIRTLRALSLSGEWVGELGGVLAVNASGLPIQRAKIAASAGEGALDIPPAVIRASVRGGELAKLIGGNIVRSCPECAKRRTALRSSAHEHETKSTAVLEEIERRTRHLVPDALEALRERVNT